MVLAFELILHSELDVEAKTNAENQYWLRQKGDN